jgi:hypothetical protein
MSATDRWPSPLPGPAWQTWRNCWDHLEATVLAGISAQTSRALRQDGAVRQAEDLALQMAHRGDVHGTNRACNAWRRALQAAALAHQARGAHG